MFSAVLTLVTGSVAVVSADDTPAETTVATELAGAETTVAIETEGAETTAATELEGATLASVGNTGVAVERF